MFHDNMEPIISNGVATIGGEYPIPKEIVTANWLGTNDEGQLHTKRLHNVI